MNALHIGLALVFGAGVYFVYIGVIDIGDLIPLGRRRLAEEDLVPSGLNNRSARLRLETLLYQARAPLNPAEFIGTSLVLGLVMGGALFFITRAALVSVFAVLAGGFAYYFYLLTRRDKAQEAYERAQPQVAYILASAFRSLGHNLDAVMEQVVATGPEIVQADWTTLRAALQGAEVDHAAINQVVSFRNSPALWRLVEAILLFRGEVEQLPEILADLRVDIAAEVEIARESAAELLGARRQLLYVAAMPAALLLLFALLSPEFKTFYATLLGQVIMLSVFAVSALIYVFGQQAATKAAQLRANTVTLPAARQEAQYRRPSAQPGASDVLHVWDTGLAAASRPSSWLEEMDRDEIDETTGGTASGQSGPGLRLDAGDFELD